MQKWINSRNSVWIFSIVIGLVAIYHFAPFFFHGQTLETDDLNLGIAKSWYGKFWRINGAWSNLTMLGQPEQIILNPSSILMMLLPPHLSISLIHIAIFFFTFYAFYFLARTFNAHRFVAAASSFLFTYSPLLNSYNATGHVGRLLLLPIICLAFGFLNRLLSPGSPLKKRLYDSAMLTLMLSLSFLTTAYQTAFFFYLLLIPYAVFLIWLAKSKEDDKKPFKKILKVDYDFKYAKTLGTKAWINWSAQSLAILAGCAVLAMLLALQPIEKAWELTNVGKSSMLAPDLPPTQGESAKWNWATQWSFPPQETIDFFIPGYLGYSSRSTSHPYWGKIGSTQNIELAKKTNTHIFKNYSLTTHYLGFYAIFFFFYSLIFTANNRWQMRQAFFWLLAIIISLMLSFGYHGFVYSWFYQLPGIESIRNPNKFLQNAHFAFFVLVVLGMQCFYSHFFRSLPSGGEDCCAKGKRHAVSKVASQSRLQQDTIGEKSIKQFAAMMKNHFVFSVIFFSFFSIVIIALLFKSIVNRQQFMVDVAIRLGDEIAKKALVNLSPSLFLAIVFLFLTVFSLWLLIKAKYKQLLFYNLPVSPPSNPNPQHPIGKNADAPVSNTINWKNSIHRSIKEKMVSLLLVACIFIAVGDLLRVNKHFYTFTDEDSHKKADAVVQKYTQLNPNYKQQRLQVVVDKYLGYYLVWKSAPYHQLPIFNNRVTRNSPVEFHTFTKRIASAEKIAQLSSIKTIVHTKKQEKLGQFPNATMTASVSALDNTVYFYDTGIETELVYPVCNVLLARNRDKVFQILNAPDFSPLKQAVAYDNSGVSARAFASYSPSSTEEKNISTTITHYRSEQIVVEISGNQDSDCAIVLSNHYDKDWRAFIAKDAQPRFLSWRNSAELKHFPVNYLFNGFILPKGVSRVVIAYAPPFLWFFHGLTLLNYFLLILLLLVKKKTLY